MVESLADELAGGQQNARRTGWQRAEFCDERGALLPGHPPVKNEQWRALGAEGRLDGVERHRANEVALVHDDVAVVLDKNIDLALAGQRLHHRDVDLTSGLCLAAADRSRKPRGGR